MVTAREYTPVDRSASAVEIAATPGSIRRNGTGYYVHSQSANVWYWTDGNRCTCPDWEKRHPAGGCKHMRALALYLKAQQPTCELCGHQGEDVTEQAGRVGGKGLVWNHYCSDRVACWHRWDVQHGLAQ